jgi:hypothetical protein
MRRNGQYRGRSVFILPFCGNKNALPGKVFVILFNLSKEKPSSRDPTPRGVRVPKRVGQYLLFLFCGNKNANSGMESVILFNFSKEERLPGIGWRGVRVSKPGLITSGDSIRYDVLFD